MLPILMAAIDLLGKKNQQAQDANQNKAAALQAEGAQLSGQGGQPPTYARGAAKEGAAQSGLGSLLGTLGSLKGNGNQADPSTIKQSNGANADPLSFSSVKALNGAGFDGQNAPSNEDLLSDY
jgi:hypothetical protein